MKFFPLLSTTLLVRLCYCVSPDSKIGSDKATQHFREANSTSQVQRVAQQILQEKQNVPDTKVGAPKPVPRHHSTKELAVPITLDLADVNTNSVDVPATTVQDGISTTYYYPKGKFYFNKIVDGGRTVWESTEKKCSPAYTISKGNVTFLALLLKKSDDETELIYYERKNLGWKLVEKTKSENIIEELKRQPEQPAVKTIDLDLSDVDSTAFSVEESEEDKVPIKKYAVKTDHYLNEINYGDSELWKSDSPDKHCTLATVYFEEENPMLLSLTLNQGFVYLKKNGKWVGVSKDDYDVALTEMKRLASLPKARTVELDVNDVDGNVFVVKEETVERVPLKTTPEELTSQDEELELKGTHIEQEGRVDTVRADTPSNSSSLDLSKEPNGDLFTFNETIDSDVKSSKYKLNTRKDKVTTIIHAEKVVWKAKTNESLEECTLYTKNGYSPMVAVLSKGDFNAERHLLRGMEGWLTISPEEFDKKLEKMKTGLPECEFSVHSEPVTIDVSRPYPSFCQSFAYDYDGVPTRMIFYGENVPVNKLVSGREKIWEREIGEKCIRSIVTMKDDKPVLVYLEKDTPSGIQFSTLLRDNGKWEVTSNYYDELKKLRNTPGSPNKFTLDLSDTQDGDKCIIFNRTFLNLPARFYVPKMGNYATEAKDGGISIWTAEKERCVSGVVYFKSGRPQLSHMTINDSNDRYLQKYFEKCGKEWKDLTEEDFYKKIEEISGRPARSKNALPEETTQSTQLSDYILDISKEPNKDLVAIHKGITPEEIKCRVYQTRDKKDKRVTSVVDGDIPIWTVRAGEEFRYCFVEEKENYSPIVAISTGNKCDKYYVKDSGKWVEIDQLSYYKRHKNMENDTTGDSNSQTAEGKDALDISKPENSGVEIKEVKMSGITQKTFTSEDSANITSVCNKGVELWSTPCDNDGLRTATLYSSGDYGLLFLQSKSVGGATDSYYFEGWSIWTPLTGEEFDRKLGDMKRTTEHLIEKLCSPLLNIEDATEGDLVTLKVEVKPGKDTHQLEYGDEVLWEDEDSSLSSAILYFDGDVPSLAVINTKSTGKEGTGYRYHDGKKWKKSDESDCRRLLNMLKIKYNPEQ
ncbi:hypothetical protein BEWA_038710 [Theileria equi strain WA]|uniref:Signal peptide containing protein n=1 Tax=Theileria equi strain WA TaxID=1537102 RepID=L1LFB1_THEEQ|nr:hypothetical protein BEWA_038710 [Theileria equi strain WA]EKX73833.1 hypothetical protein BEWA_038710 [Theileria equi strain WA]|eukprot:XP_004833285.1 hypothetical protein BEWA_038710 [Theileria equi strain WA]